MMNAHHVAQCQQVPPLTCVFFPRYLLVIITYKQKPGHCAVKTVTKMA